MRKAIGLYHIIIGASALYFWFISNYSWFPNSNFLYLILVVNLIWGGYCTWRNEWYGMVLLIGMNLLQTFNFHYDQVDYRFGFGWRIYFDLKRINFYDSFNFGLSNYFYRDAAYSCIRLPIDFYLTINLTSLLLMIILLLQLKNSYFKNTHPWELDFQKN